MSTTSFTQKQLKTYPWLVVLMLWSICFLNYADRQVIFSVFPLLSHEFGFSKLQLGLIGSSFMWLYTGGSFAAGWLADRSSRKRLIFGDCFFWSLATILTGSCSKLWHFIMVRMLEGLGEVFYFPASTALIADYLSSRLSDARIFIQMLSLCFGGGVIITVGAAPTIPMILLAMTCYGFFKGGYDGGIFASQFDYVEPQFRGSIAGLVNVFAGAGGALGIFIVGAVSTYGKEMEMANMSKAISWSASIYFLGALFLFLAFLINRKERKYYHSFSQ